MRVLLVDDHPVIHEIMWAVLARALNPKSIFVAKDMPEALDRAQQVKQLDLVVLDLGLPGCSGIEALTQFRRSLPRPAVVVLSAIEDSEAVIAAFDAGARGYIPKTATVDVMMAALSLVAAGGTYVPPEMLRKHSPKSSYEALAHLDLSHRQIEVLHCLVRGLPNREIAQELGISESTAKQHVRAVLRALGVSTRTEALIASARLGIKLDNDLPRIGPIAPKIRCR